MPAVFHFRHRVLDDEIDDQGHVNNVEYVKWMQIAAVAHSAEQGWHAERYRELGAGWVARTHVIEYLAPAYRGDEIIVQTWVSNFKKITSLRKYKIVQSRDETLLAVAETNWAFIGLTLRVPRRIPAELIDSFELVPAAAEP